VVTRETSTPTIMRWVDDSLIVNVIKNWKTFLTPVRAFFLKSLPSSAETFYNGPNEGDACTKSISARSS